MLAFHMLAKGWGGGGREVTAQQPQRHAAHHPLCTSAFSFTYAHCTSQFWGLRFSRPPQGRLHRVPSYYILGSSFLCCPVHLLYCPLGMCWNVLSTEIPLIYFLCCKGLFPFVLLHCHFPGLSGGMGGEYTCSVWAWTWSTWGLDPQITHKF